MRNHIFIKSLNQEKETSQKGNKLRKETSQNRNQIKNKNQIETNLKGNNKEINLKKENKIKLLTYIRLLNQGFLLGLLEV